MEGAIEAIGVEHIDGVVVLTPRVDLDVVRVPLLEQRFQEALAKGTRHFVLDLSQLGLLSSTGAGLMLSLRRRLQEVGGKLRLVGAPRSVTGTLRTMGVDSLFRIDETVKDALQALSQRPAS